MEVHNNLGVAYSSKRPLVSAIEQYQTAIRLNPDYAEVHYNLGNVYLSKGSLDLAIEQYQAALRAKPDYAEVHFNLGLIYLNNGSINNARTDFELVLKNKPDYALAREILNSSTQNKRKGKFLPSSHIISLSLSALLRECCRKVKVRRIRYKYTLAASVALLAFLVYLPALRNEFVYWDDNLYIVENPDIRSLDMALFRWAFFGFHVSNWHPITWMSHAVDYALWGMNPLGHHLTNIVLHAINTALVVMLTLKLLEIAQERIQRNAAASFLTGRTVLTAAGVTGLLFGVHPVHVESVAWAAERKDLLCALFFLLSVLAYVKAVGRMRQSTDGIGQSAGFKKLTLGAMPSSLCFFALALMSKPMAVSLPAVLLILDWHPLKKIRSFQTSWSAIVEKIPFLYLSLASSILAIIAQKAGGALSTIDKVPLSIRLLVASKSLIAYLGKMLLPVNLIPLYPYPRDVSLLSIEYLAAILLVMGVTAACVVLAKKQQIWLAAWGYYVLTLMPVLGIVQVGNQAMADRYTYLPSLGLFFLAGVGAAWISEKIFWNKSRALFTRGAGVTISVLLVLCLSYLTVRQTAVWRDSLSLWTYVIEKEPRKIPLAYNNRGMVFFKVGKFNQAIADFNQAIAMVPEYAKAYYNRGSAYDKMGELDKAIADYRKTILLDPFYYEAYYYLDQALKKTEQVDKRTL